MSDKFNPLEQWLGLSRRLRSPNLYQLLGLREYENDAETIRVAADRAIARVRSQRPGDRTEQWAKLLDALKNAKAVLSDPQRKSDYDARLKAQGTAQQSGEQGARPKKKRRVQRAAKAAAQGSAPPTASEEPIDFVAVEAAEPSPSFDPLDPMAPIDPTMFAYPPPTAPAPSPAPAAVLPAATATAAIAQSSLPQASEPPSTDAAPPTIFSTPRRRSLYGSGAMNFVAGVAVGVLLTIGGLAVKNHFFSEPTMEVAQNSSAGGTTTNPSTSGLTSNHGSNESNPSGSGNTAPAGDNDTTSSGTTNGETAPNGTANPPVNDANASPPPVVNDSAPDVTAYPDNIPEPAPVPDNPTPPVPDNPTLTPDNPAPTVPANTDPPTPPSIPPPTAEQLKALAEKLVSARDAIWRHDFESADAALTEAMQMARLPEHQAMVSRLHSIGQYMREFRAGVDRAMQTLEAGVSFQISDSIIVAVVERRPDEIVIKVAGRNQTYPLNDLPLLLGLALFDQGTMPGPEALAIKGAFQAVHPRSNDEHRAEVRDWWMQAAEELPQVQEMLPFLDDDYSALQEKAQ